MKKLIRKILREHKSDRHYKILDKISDHVQLPYFKSMEGLTIYEHDDQEYIMRNILGNDISIIGKSIHDDRGNRIYWELSNDKWRKTEYDDKGNLIYYEHSGGYWEKHEYDDRGKLIYYEDSDGWKKYEYDDKGNRIYYEDSNGYIEDYR
jgi:YD repeat-containing protein